MFTSVWEHNMLQELYRFDLILHTHKNIAFDTEFPGFVRNTPRNASELLRYDDLKYNVDNLKLIQLGITLFDVEGNIGGIWEFNFKDFDADTDLHVPISIQLLKKNGVDLEKMKTEGIDEASFALIFGRIVSSHYPRLSWVTFHGLYDIGYITKLVTRSYLPISLGSFMEIIGKVFGTVYDTKYMCRFCDGCLKGELGLEKLANILKVERIGQAHQAGSDSLLTTFIFLKMMHNYSTSERLFRGCLYGVKPRIMKSYVIPRAENHEGLRYSNSAKATLFQGPRIMKGYDIPIQQKLRYSKGRES